MKKFLLFLLITVTSSFITNACGYYPYGEDIRFNILKPTFVYPNSGNPFFYSSSLFYNGTPRMETWEMEDNENIQLWFEYLNKEVSKKAIFEAVYQAEISELKNTNSTYAFVSYLYRIGRKDILDYLILAKSCSSLNSWMEDPWERKEEKLQKERRFYYAKAIRMANSTDDSQLKRRYAHLAIRLAFYNSDKSAVQKTYSQFFSSSVKKDAIDYWAMHFKLHFDPSSVQRNIDVALVFKNSPEKQFAVHRLFDKAISYESMIKKASNNQERAAICYLLGSMKLEKSMIYLKGLEKYEPSSSHLTELILRETNKLEDWILTPYYSNFQSSTPFSWYEPEILPTRMDEQIKEDRLYALELNSWLKQLEIKDSLKDEWLSTFVFYTTYLSGNDKKAATEYTALLNEKIKNEDISKFLNKIYPLIVIIGEQDADLKDQKTQESLMQLGDDDYQFIFALAKELEFKGNKDLAACLLAKLSEGTNSYMTSWKSKGRHSSLAQDFYYEYFTYLDVAYGIEDMNQVIAFSESRGKNVSKFDKWLYSALGKDPSRLYDLLGTKYLRGDQLEDAEIAFSKVESNVWKNEDYGYIHYLNEDPFINNFYDAGVLPKEDSKRSYSKPQIIRRLRQLKEVVENSEGDKKAIAAYKVANCYRNMSYYGNSWMMRRYFWSTNMHKSNIEDDPEYFGCIEAKKFYLIASKSANTRKFAALAMRMAGKCENFRLISLSDDFYLSAEEYDSLFYENSVYKDLKSQFPEDYEPLTSSCDQLVEYYHSIK